MSHVRLSTFIFDIYRKQSSHRNGRGYSKILDRTNEIKKCSLSPYGKYVTVNSVSSIQIIDIENSDKISYKLADEPSTIFLPNSDIFILIQPPYIIETEKSLIFKRKLDIKILISRNAIDIHYIMYINLKILSLVDIQTFVKIQ